jgi:tetratricopeptide (TPR) repeat protein
MKRIVFFPFFFVLLFTISVQAQTLITKDAMNSFASYLDTKDIKDLENARKLIDNGYKNKADSIAFKNNMIRALVYATLARVDSNLRLSYVKDPVDETLFAMKQVYGSKFEEESQNEIRYINDHLLQTYLYRANTSFRERRFADALKYFTILDSLKPNTFEIIHNLALLHQELGNYQESTVFYEKLIEQNPKPEYYMMLANLYELLGEETSTLKVLKDGTQIFPSNRDLIFKLINILGNRNDYSEITRFIEQALKLDEYNINLNYLAGFSNEMTGNHEKAEEYYKALLNINPNNYEGNYALGLLYLNSYLKDKTRENLKYVSKYYLTKANEIDPNELKSLTSLSILYKYTGDNDELQPTKIKLKIA